MIALLNILIFLAFLAGLIISNQRVVLQVKKLKCFEANFLFILFLLGVNILFLAFSASEFELLSEDFKSVPLDKVMLAALGCLTFCSLSFAAMSSVKNMTNKQLRTLLRLPIIGILLGIYLDLRIGLLGVVVIHLLITFYYYKNKEKLLYNCRQHFKAVCGLYFFLGLGYYDCGYFSITGFLFYVIMNIQIINALKLKIQLESKELENLNES